MGEKSSSVAGIESQQTKGLEGEASSATGWTDSRLERWEEKQVLPIDWLDVTTAIKTRRRTKYYSRSRETPK